MFAFGNQILAGIRAIHEQEQAEQQAQEQVPRPIRRRTSVRREHVLAHQRLFEDYFAEHPRWGAPVFRRRFRMRRELFLQIVHALEARDEYFQWREDAAHRKGPSPLTKCTVALRQLAYGTTSNMFDEYLHVGDTTGRECLVNFCAGVIDAFGATYLRKPNAQDCQDLLRMHDTVHGFPGMLGSIDCMHWEWKNCPAAWRGQFTSGYKGTHPTMILEAIVDHSLWIWHAHFGVAGSNNDINVLNSSSLFTEQCNGNGPVISFTANGRQHHMGYYLADGIYPRWPVFLKTISCPTGARREFFAAKQEAARKDVERGFGVLQTRWGIVKGPACSWYKHHIANVMYACIILHT
ncbi:protein ALP1-like [Salvia hispanica]|uniref:protein ALP1-like n=1 Tax=Salvia hispanica TaxID=49212 RepID=UPI0020095939|nr:protein ALP1-like [Salvia hispanica]